MNPKSKGCLQGETACFCQKLRSAELSFTETRGPKESLGYAFPQIQNMLTTFWEDSRVGSLGLDDTQTKKKSKGWLSLYIEPSRALKWGTNFSNVWSPVRCWASFQWRECEDRRCSLMAVGLIIENSLTQFQQRLLSKKALDFFQSLSSTPSWGGLIAQRSVLWSPRLLISHPEVHHLHSESFEC